MIPFVLISALEKKRLVTELQCAIVVWDSLYFPAGTFQCDYIQYIFIDVARIARGALCIALPAFLSNGRQQQLGMV